MYPEIVRIGDFVISSYGLMMVLAFITANIILRKDLSDGRNGFSLDQGQKVADDLIFYAAFGGVAGAKIYYLVEGIPTGSAADNLRGLSDILQGIFTLSFSKISLGIQNFGAGLVFLGGFIGGVLAITLYTRKNNLNWLVVVDWLAPLLALGHGIGRIGCFLVGDDYGKATDLPWAIAFPNGIPPTQVAVHPTQLYEMTCYFLIFIYLRYLVSTRKDRFSGQIFFEFLFLHGLSRFLVEFVRINPKYLLGLSGAQIISAIMVILGSVMMFRLRKSAKQSIEVE